MGFPGSFPTNGDAAAGDEHSIHLYILDVVKGTYRFDFVFVLNVLLLLWLTHSLNAIYVCFFYSRAVFECHHVSLHLRSCTELLTTDELCVL